MFLEVPLLVLAVQILSHLRTCFWDQKCLCWAECFWALLTQWTLHWLQFLKTTLQSQHLTNNYIIPSSSEQPLLKGLRKKWVCFWDLPWKLTILSSLIFQAMTVPHLTAPVGIGDRWKLASCASFYYSLGISGWSWIQATVPRAEDEWGKKS